MHRYVRRILSWTAVAVAGWVPAAAYAGTVAITQVSGPVSEDIASSLEAAFRKQPGVRVVGLEEWKNAASRARLDPARDLSKIARRVGADRLVRAKVSKDEQRWRLTVQVYDRRGKALDRWRVKAKKLRRLDFLIERKMMTRLGSAIASGGKSAKAPTNRRRSARATAAKTAKTVRLGLLSLQGGKRTAGRLAKLLNDYPNIKRIPDRQIEQTAADLGANLDTARGRAEVARALRLKAWLSVRSRGRRRRYAASGKVYSGHDGRLIDTVEGRGRSEKAALLGMVTQLDAPLSDAQAPKADARGAEPMARRAIEADTDDDRPRRRSAPVQASALTASADGGLGVEGDIPVARPSKGRNRSPLMLALGMSLQSRDFSYNEDALQNLRPYELAGAPAVSGELRWYPAGHFVDGILAHIGIEGRLRYLVGVTSEDSEGTEQFNTSSSDIFGGLRGRLPFGTHEAGLALGFGHHNFTVELPEGGPALPGVGYTYLRAGLDARFTLPANFNIYLGGAWRQPLSTGEIGDEEWFPNASQGGLDAQLALGWSFLTGFEARLGAEYTRYFFSLNPEVDDAFVAGGALDQYIAGTIDLVWSLDG